MNLELLKQARARMEAANFTVANITEATAAYEVFRRAVRRVVVSTSTVDDAALKALESKSRILDFLDGLQGRDDLLHSRILSTLALLLDYEEWRKAAKQDESAPQRSAATKSRSTMRNRSTTENDNSTQAYQEPFQNDEDVGAAALAQGAAVMGGVGFVAVCLLCCCLRVLQVQRRKPSAGTVKIYVNDQKVRLSWSVEHRIPADAPIDEEDCENWSTEDTERISELQNCERASSMSSVWSFVPSLLSSRFSGSLASRIGLSMSRLTVPSTASKPRYSGRSGRSAADSAMSKQSKQSRLKEHVVWDIDREVVERWFAENRVVVEEFQEFEAEEREVLDNPVKRCEHDENSEYDEMYDDEFDNEYDDESWPSSRCRALSPTGITGCAPSLHVTSTPETRTPLTITQDELEWWSTQEAAIPLISTGEIVEYWSASNLVWMYAVLEAVVDEADDDEVPRIEYALKVGRSQVRQHVPFDAFRLQLREYEPVDVFSRRNGGMWLPARMCSHQPAGASTIGYRVYVEAEKLTLDKVPGVRIRRRFPAGVPVEVYRGPRYGWMPAVVHSAAGTQHEGYPDPLDEAQSPGGHYCRGEPMFRPWTLVPIFEEQPGLEGVVEYEPAPEIVPSYLLRHPFSFVVSTQNDDSKRLKIL